MFVLWLPWQQKELACNFQKNINITSQILQKHWNLYINVDFFIFFFSFCHNVIKNRMVISGHTHIKTCWKKEKKNLLSMLTDLSGILYKLMPLSFELATWVDVSVPRFVCGAEYGHSLGVLRHDSLHRVCGASYVNGWVILNLQKTEPHS